jgi:AmiR/NasT family two-component response regulator
VQTSEQPRSGHVVIGVDTHKHVHVAAVMDTIGGIVATLTIPTDTGGFQPQLKVAAASGINTQEMQIVDFRTWLSEQTS